MRKPLRERLIEQGIITPGTEALRTWLDPQYGYQRWERPAMGAESVARYRARLIRHGFLVPREMRWQHGKLH